MIFPVNSTHSAVMAYGNKMSVHADRVANAYSDGLNRSMAIQQEGDKFELTVETDCIESTDYSVIETSEGRVTHSESDTGHSESSNVDIVAEMVDIKICRRAYEANLSFIKTEDEMAGAILDLLS